MTIDDETIDSVLAALPEPTLSAAVQHRTLILARANLPASRASMQSPLLGRVAAAAVPSALLSADLVFLVDACAKMGRGLGSG
jgi:hypothetical protein